MGRIGYNPNGVMIRTDVPQGKIDMDFIAHFQVAAADAVATSNVGVHAAITMPETDPLEVVTEITNPAVPRSLIVKGNASGIAGDVVIEGTNIAGEEITETIALNGSTAVEGSKAFKTVTSITIPARNAEANTVSVGWGNKLGLPFKLAHDTVLFALLDNTKQGTAPTVTASTTAIESNTCKLNSALNGKIVDVYLVV